MVLASHPDKGGDPAVFRDQNEAFESLRELYDSGRVHRAGFAHYLGGGAAEGRQGGGARREAPRREWSWYEAAASESVPPYRTEAARSGRSTCKGACHGNPKEPEACVKHGLGPLIPDGSLRCGSMDPESGTYGRWRHIECWRVPACVWLGLPDPAASDATAFEEAIVSMQSVTLCGFVELPPPLKKQFVAFVMDRDNWAKLTATSAAKAAAAAAARAEGGGGGGAGHYAPPFAPAFAAAPAAGSYALAPVGGGGRFLMPRPGVSGAMPDAFRGKTFVLTGVYVYPTPIPESPPRKMHPYTQP
jgi:hypothetical protein